MKVNAVFTEPLNVSADFVGDLAINGEMVNLLRIAEYEDYTGDYEVTSFASTLASSLVLPTLDKHMTDNVTIHSLPTTEEYNDAGGVTMTIG